jgi:hypothetical protein
VSTNCTNSRKFQKPSGQTSPGGASATESA